jgi:hypothetical protein
MCDYVYICNDVDSKQGRKIFLKHFCGLGMRALIIFFNKKIKIIFSF